MAVTPLICPHCGADDRTPSRGGAEPFRLLETITVFRAVLRAEPGRLVVRALVEMDLNTRASEAPRLQCRQCLGTFPTGGLAIVSEP
jgi:hypothetical protein